MWTRIQILYISIATILVGSLFFCDFATIIGPEGSSVSIAYREKIPFLVLNIMTFTAQVAALASTKVRFLQMRVCIISALILLGFQAWLAIDFFASKDQMVFSFTALFPILAALLNALAARNIMVDEMVVQTYHRMHPKNKKNPKKR